jgi:hypothetical protein
MWEVNYNKGVKILESLYTLPLLVLKGPAPFGYTGRAQEFSPIAQAKAAAAQV